MQKYVFLLVSDLHRAHNKNYLESLANYVTLDGGERTYYSPIIMIFFTWKICDWGLQLSLFCNVIYERPLFVENTDSHQKLVSYS